jgi:hypothetical protein
VFGEDYTEQPRRYSRAKTRAVIRDFGEVAKFPTPGLGKQKGDCTDKNRRPPLLPTMARHTIPEPRPMW